MPSQPDSQGSVFRCKSATNGLFPQGLTDSLYARSLPRKVCRQRVSVQPISIKRGRDECFPEHPENRRPPHFDALSSLGRAFRENLRRHSIPFGGQFQRSFRLPRKRPSKVAQLLSFREDPSIHFPPNSPAQRPQTGRCPLFVPDLENDATFRGRPKYYP